MKKHGLVIIIFIIFIGFGIWQWYKTIPRACPQNAIVCLDGSTVGILPDCRSAPCSNEFLNQVEISLNESCVVPSYGANMKAVCPILGEVKISDLVTAIIKPARSDKTMGYREEHQGTKQYSDVQIEFIENGGQIGVPPFTWFSSVDVGHGFSANIIYLDKENIYISAMDIG